MLKFKRNIMPELKAAGYNSRKLRLEGILGEATMTKIRKLQIVSMNELAKICSMLNCQPGDIIEYIPDKTEQ